MPFKWLLRRQFIVEFLIKATCQAKVNLLIPEASLYQIPLSGRASCAPGQGGMVVIMNLSGPPPELRN